MTTPEPTEVSPVDTDGLRKRIAEVLTTSRVPNRDPLVDESHVHANHDYSYACHLCTNNVEALTAALLPVFEQAHGDLVVRAANLRSERDALKRFAAEANNETERLRAELVDLRFNLSQRAYTAPDADDATMLSSLDARITDALASRSTPALPDDALGQLATVLHDACYSHDDANGHMVHFIDDGKTPLDVARDVLDLVRSWLSSPATDLPVPQHVWPAVRMVALRAREAGQNAYWTWHAVYTALRSLGYTVDDGTRPVPATDPEPATPDGPEWGVMFAGHIVRPQSDEAAARKYVDWHNSVGTGTNRVELVKREWVHVAEPVAPQAPAEPAGRGPGDAFERFTAEVANDPERTASIVAWLDAPDEPMASCGYHTEAEAQRSIRHELCTPPAGPAVPEDTATPTGRCSGCNAANEFWCSCPDGYTPPPDPTWIGHEVAINVDAPGVVQAFCVTPGCGSFSPVASENEANDWADSHRADTTRPEQSGQEP